MLFPTLDFAIFFVIIFSGSWLLISHRTARQWLLIIASYFFYGYWDWRFCFLLFTASTTAWLAGRWIEAAKTPYERKTIAVGASMILLCILGFFKYYGFFLDNIAPLLVQTGLQRDQLLLQIILPVGISFFTFQAISYVVDVYRGEIPARRSLADLLLYVSFFPQLVAGPIVRAAHFLPQLDTRPALSRHMMVFGFTMCLIGLFKKMVVANYLAVDLVDPVFFDPSAYSSLALLVAVYGYAVQIYCDFSGYSDMAIGTAALLGYRFNANFRQPYRASSLREFWRRWHISLSQWLRDYLYKSLGGNRSGSLVTYRNLMLTMLLGGLWHGAAWTFIIWGLLHGIGLALERILAPIGAIARLVSFKPMGIIATFHFVCVGWIFFRSQSFDYAIDYFEGLLRLDGATLGVSSFSVGLIIIGMAMQFVPERWSGGVISAIGRWPYWAMAGGFAIALVAIDLLAPPGTAPFIYFQF